MNNIRTITTTALTTALLGLSILAGPADANAAAGKPTVTAKKPNQCHARSRAGRFSCRIVAPKPGDKGGPRILHPYMKG